MLRSEVVKSISYLILSTTRSFTVTPVVYIVQLLLILIVLIASRILQCPFQVEEFVIVSGCSASRTANIAQRVDDVLERWISHNSNYLNVCKDLSSPYILCIVIVVIVIYRRRYTVIQYSDSCLFSHLKIAQNKY